MKSLLVFSLLLSLEVQADHIVSVHIKEGPYPYWSGSLSYHAEGLKKKADLKAKIQCGGEALRVSDFSMHETYPPSSIKGFFINVQALYECL